MSDDSPDSAVQPACTAAIDPAEVQAHVARVKAAWREHERAMSWEQKVAAIERMWERSAQLDRARQMLAKQEFSARKLR